MLLFVIAVQGFFIWLINLRTQDLASQLLDGRSGMIQGFQKKSFQPKNQTLSRSTNNGIIQKEEHQEYHTTCSVSPGAHNVDINPEGFQILNFMGFFAEQERQKQNDHTGNRIVLLCVLPFLSDSEENAILQTYARECDKILILTEDKDRSSLPWKGTNLNVTTTITRTRAYNREQILESMLSLKPFDWVHWAKSDEYVVVPLLKAAVSAPLARNSELSDYPFHEESPEVPNMIANRKDQPLVLSTWVLKEFDKIFHIQPSKVPYRLQDFRNDLGCSAAQTYNVEVLRYVSLEGYSNVTFRMHSNFTLLDPKTIEEATICATPDFVFRGYKSDCRIDENPYCESIYLYNGVEVWSPLKRYTQISLPLGANATDSYYRIHDILNSLCKDQWDKKSYQTLDSDGTPGYVHDPFYLKKHPPRFQPFIDGDLSGGNCDEKLGDGIEGPHGLQGLQKIRTDLPEHVVRMNKTVLCMVYSYSGNRDYLNAIAETWAPKCDGFVAASDETDPSVGAMHMTFEGGESYGNMWNKLRAMYRYAYDHYLNDFDVFYVLGDDVYVIVENLKYLISIGGAKGPWDESRPLFAGAPRSFPSGDALMCLGGPGYLFNRLALKILVEDMLDTPGCFPHCKLRKVGQRIDRNLQVPNKSTFLFL